MSIDSRIPHPGSSPELYQRLSAYIRVNVQEYKTQPELAFLNSIFPAVFTLDLVQSAPPPVSLVPMPSSQQYIDQPR